MVAIRISDHVDRASTYLDGQKIYDLIAPHIVAGDVVELSFEGISAVPSAFVNAALVQLLEVVSMDRIKRSLRIVHSTRYINDLIRRRFEFVTSRPSPGPMPTGHLLAS